jgi:uncharacterized protein YndB with AHSA1/START domain
MPVKKDSSGRRSVEAEVEVPGSPEEVWQAIATGPGISSWLVPTELDGRDGGSAISHFGPGNSMDSVATITLWDPPRRFVAETQEGPGTVATEWIVEAQSGGACVVRVVHSWFASTDDWDDQFEGHTYGWIAFFRILRLYLTHFRGTPGATFQLMGVSAQPTFEAWKTLAGPLGLVEATEGDRVSSPAGAPSFAGLVERVGPQEFPELLLRLDRPTCGLAHLFALPMGGQTFLPVRFYLYGDRSADSVSREEAVWQAWMAAHVKPPGETNA